VDIRAYAPADLESVLDLAQSRMPFIERDEIAKSLNDPTASFAPSLVAVDPTNTVVARAFVAWLPSLPGDMRVARIQVAKNLESTGLGGRLARMLHAGLGPGVRTVITSVLDDDAHSLAVAEHWGFRRNMHGISIGLDLDDLPEPATVEGTNFEVLPNYSPDLDAQVDDLLIRAATEPETRHGLRMSAAPMREDLDYRGSPLTVLARTNGRLIGLTTASVAGPYLYTYYLCVDPAYRRRGVALAMKQRLHLAARDLGATRVETTNEAANVEARGLNARLGFTRIWGEHRLAWSPVES